MLRKTLTVLFIVFIISSFFIINVYSNHTWYNGESFGSKFFIHAAGYTWYNNESFGSKLVVDEPPIPTYTWYDNKSFGSKAVIISPSERNATIRTNAIGFFCYRGDNTTAANFSDNITGFDEASEYISVWKNSSWSDTDWKWQNYYGNDVGDDFLINRFDVVRIYLDDGEGYITIDMYDTQEICECSGKSVNLSYSTNRGYNYTCFCVDVSITGYDTLKKVAQQSPLTTGESIAWWNNSSYQWEVWIVSITPDSFNHDVSDYDVFETKVSTNKTWVLP